MMSPVIRIEGLTRKYEMGNSTVHALRSANLSVEAGEFVALMDASGSGIPPEDLPRLFERFHCRRNSSAFPGNGLGLAIVKAIVDVHGGTVEAQSAGKDAGSAFTITLPT